MSRKWHLGDLAVVGDKVGGEPTEWMAQRVSGGWDSLDGGIGYISDAQTKFARRLVVIDPEDRERVVRIAAAVSRAGSWCEVADMQTALREIANPSPPKPDEPMGLGAVVEDCDGVRWVRVFCPDVEGGVGVRWATGAVRDCWANIDAVTVLSEGVQ